jgi:hypothetical protein
MGLHYKPDTYSEADIWASRVVHLGTYVASDGTNGWFGGFTDAANYSVFKVTPAGVETEYTIDVRLYGIQWDALNGWFWIFGYNLAGSFKFGKLSTAGVFTDYTANYTSVCPNVEVAAMLHDGTNLWVAGQNSTAEDLEILKVSASGVFTAFTTIARNTQPRNLMWDGTNGWCVEPFGDYIDKITPAGVVTSYAATSPYFATLMGSSIYCINSISSYKVFKILLSSGVTSDVATLDAMQQGIGNDGTELWTGSDTDDKVLAITTAGVKTEYDMGLPAPAPDTEYDVPGILYAGSHLWIAYIVNSTLA